MVGGLNVTAINMTVAKYYRWKFKPYLQRLIHEIWADGCIFRFQWDKNWIVTLLQLCAGDIHLFHFYLSVAKSTRWCVKEIVNFNDNNFSSYWKLLNLMLHCTSFFRLRLRLWEKFINFLILKIFGIKSIQEILSFSYWINCKEHWTAKFQKWIFLLILMLIKPCGKPETPL